MKNITSILGGIIILGCLAQCATKQDPISYSLMNLNNHDGYDSTYVETVIESRGQHNIGDTVVVLQLLTVTEQDYIESMYITSLNPNIMESNYMCLIDTVGNKVNISQYYRMVVVNR